MHVFEPNDRIYSAEVNQNFRDLVDRTLESISNINAASAVSGQVLKYNEYTATGGTSPGGQGNFLIYDETAQALRIAVTSNGNVVIGTTVPENKLHVNGAINLDPIVEPAAPTTGFVLYVDSADEDLKAKSHNETIATIA